MAIIAILGYYLSSAGGGGQGTIPSSSSNQPNGAALAGQPTVTERIGCPLDGDADGEMVQSLTSTVSQSGTVTIQKGACVVDSDGDGF